MNRKFPNLCKPITLGRVTFKNRMFSAPMGGTDITNDGCIGPKSTAFYELRAKGGAGAVTVSECMVHPKTDGSHAYHLDSSILNSLQRQPTRQMQSAAMAAFLRLSCPIRACMREPT